jgi:hypothetical protein
MITNKPDYNYGSGEPMYPGYGVGDNYGLNEKGLRGLGDVTTGPNPPSSTSLLDTISQAGLNLIGITEQPTFDWKLLLILGGMGYMGYQLMFSKDARKARGKRALDKEYRRHSTKINRIQSRYKLGIEEMGASKRRLAVA